ncbi:tRNA synthetases class I, catalytic domain-containing protein [Syncephalis pseudoplumigaleata]|uniref:Probable glutamate--tRNA ligase, cytoplasmic n=1 Tax=Syncephalis pseudoplumigaleata TaxID=1712513 RepID=A0A4P9Z5X3_9FUNG|nr:tRNA synthetases class I, catalytic domain-containing protein [Syncephalis pseudoplumigaleata]|eukprot:RKP28054.1 tRNA synthetases class I, catalytic domain-containing protein [Syncephalis pseudoplumigaleata]
MSSGSSITVTLALKAAPFPAAVNVLVHMANAAHAGAIKLAWEDAKTLADQSTAKLDINNETTVSGDAAVLTRLAEVCESALLNGGSDTEKQAIARWVEFSQRLSTTDFKALQPALEELNHHLLMRTFLVGHAISLADIACWGALRASPVFARVVKNPDGPAGIALPRWFQHIASLAPVSTAVVAQQTAANAVKERRDQGKFDIGLKDAVKGGVVTRFPPEPSGYLHIGHAKAALLNDYFAREYEGKLIVRFDDTNPSKEKSEFEDSITEDLELLGIRGDVITHTSDYFDQIYEYALQMIREGKAYVDDTDQATMRAQRMDGIASRCRDQSVEENMRRFDEMKRATEFGLTCCLRAKLSVDAKNKALRDPVIYRCNVQPHHLTGDRWKIYPTYDFACPIVDSLEGVTHALRTNEYRDRNPQYEWFLKALNLRWVHIWDYSRMNFVYTLLSKRKLQWFVDQGHVGGWDDPRFPTVRGIRRRGMTIEALRQYILMQGASQNQLLLEWDKLWALNKKVIDPVAPRHTAICQENCVVAKLIGAPETPEVRAVLKHKKNPEVGEKQTVYAAEVYLEQADAASFEQGEEITLMDWGNAVVESLEREDITGIVTGMQLRLNLAGNPKLTKKKVTWLSSMPERPLVPVKLHDFDYLINKKKLEEDDNVADYLTAVTEFCEEALADYNVVGLAKGDIVQLERRGYYIVDRPYDAANPAGNPIHLFCIPDGKAVSMASKAGAKPVALAGDAADAVGATLPERVGNMHTTQSVYGDLALPTDEQVSSMYSVKKIY